VPWSGRLWALFAVVDVAMYAVVFGDHGLSDDSRVPLVGVVVARALVLLAALNACLRPYAPTPGAGKQ
jgi:hypothetical protein